MALIEAADPHLQPLVCLNDAGPAPQLANRLRQASWTMQAHRTDLSYGRTVRHHLCRGGLIDVAAEVSFSLAGPALARLHRTMIEWAREAPITLVSFGRNVTRSVVGASPVARAPTAG